MKQTGLIVALPKPTSYIAGQETTVKGKVLVPDGNWTPFLPKFERQSTPNFDTMSCASFSLANVLEMVMKHLPLNTKQELFKLGFNQDFEISKRALAIMSGTTAQGNTFERVLDTARNKGIVPESMLPFGGTSFAEYHNPAVITPAILDIANKVTKLLDIKYDWVFFDQNPTFTDDQFTASESALVTSPLQIGIQTPASHAVSLVDLAKMNNQPYYTILDQYDPFILNGTGFYPQCGIRVEIDSKLVTVDVPTIPENYIFTSYLQKGSTGDEVSMLQRVLISQKCLATGLVTGRFLDKTESALKLLQARYGIATVGKTGPKTRALLNELVKKKSSNQLNEKGKEFIKKEEGCRLCPYKDTGGVWTIGYGNTTLLDGTPVKSTTKCLTNSQAGTLFDSKLPIYEQMVADKINITLNPNQYTALVSLCWNSGALSDIFAHIINSGLMTEKIWTSYRNTDRSGSTDSMGRPILYSRRLREYKLFITK